jgi:hypothetical protein
MKLHKLHVEKLIRFVYAKMGKYLDGEPVCMDN